MRTSFAAIGVLLVIASCDTNDAISLTELKKLNVSQEKWNNVKVKNKNSYAYSISFTSWSGYGNITVIKVTDGIVVERKYSEFIVNQITGQQDISLAYTEDQAHLGSNQNGALPLTMDELYHTCGKEYLVMNTRDNDLHFETSDIGLMNLCGYVPKNCMDDCFNGIVIKTFEWL